MSFSNLHANDKNMHIDLNNSEVHARNRTRTPRMEGAFLTNGLPSLLLEDYQLP